MSTPDVWAISGDSSSKYERDLWNLAITVWADDRFIWVAGPIKVDNWDRYEYSVQDGELGQGIFWQDGEVAWTFYYDPNRRAYYVEMINTNPQSGTHVAFRMHRIDW
jgi:hypothetical protein